MGRKRSLAPDDNSSEEQWNFRAYMKRAKMVVDIAKIRASVGGDVELDGYAPAELRQSYEMMMYLVQDFFTDVKLLYHTVSHLCTHTKCPVMTGGPHLVYAMTSAPAYIEYVFQVLDESISQQSDVAPAVAQSMISRVQEMCQAIFRVYAHLYHCHYVEFMDVGADVHLRMCSRRFLAFVVELELVDETQLAPSLAWISAHQESQQQAAAQQQQQHERRRLLSSSTSGGSDRSLGGCTPPLSPVYDVVTS